MPSANRNAFEESGVSPYTSQEPAGLSAMHIDLLIPRKAIRDVNNFKLTASHMIDKDDGL